jgi:hypothetical protein
MRQTHRAFLFSALCASNHAAIALLRGNSGDLGVDHTKSREIFENKIVGGTAAAQGEFPFYGELQYHVVAIKAILRFELTF